MPHTVNKILLLDDDLENADIFEMGLKEVYPDIELSVARDNRALSMLINSKYLPDLILMDLSMPLKLGKKCLTENKSSLKYRKVPVVILSSTDDQTNIGFCKANSVQNHFRKLVSFAGTIKRVTDHCNGNY